MTITTIGTILTVIVLPLIGWGFKLYRDLQKEKLSEQQRQRLTAVAESAVRASEELGGKEKWTSQQKVDFAAQSIKSAFPQVNEATVKLLIHAAVQAVGIGFTAKNVNAGVLE
jgi:type III secretory pathway component EscR